MKKNGNGAVPRIGDLIPDPKNANRGTQRGRGMVEDSLRKYGAGRSVLVDKHMRLIAGNKTAEAAGGIGLDEIVLVQTDGKKLVVVQRTDLDLEKDKAARLLAIADNRTGEIGLEWEPDVLGEIDSKDLEGLFTVDELGDLLGGEDEGGGDSGRESDNAEIDEQFLVLVTCKTEAEQLELIRQMQTEGRECRALMS